MLIIFLKETRRIYNKRINIMTGFCGGVGGKELGGWGTKWNRDSLLYAYLYIMSNFELYITYSEREMEGEGRKKKGEKQNKKKKDNKAKCHPLLSRMHLLFCLTIKW